MVPRIFSLALLLCFLSIPPALAVAPPPADWSLAPTQPHVEAAIPGTACRLQGTTLCVAGTDFKVVDVASWDRPAVQGSVALPAAAVDLALAWPRAFVACGDAGVVALDLSDPRQPRATGRYDPPAAVDRVVVVRDVIVAIDRDSRLHFLAPAAAGSLAALNVFPWPTAIADATEANGFLVIAEDYRLKAVDVRDVRAPVITGMLNPSTYFLYRTSLCAHGRDLWCAIAYGVNGDMVVGTDTAFQHCLIGDNGALSAWAGVDRLPGMFSDLASNGRHVVVVNDRTVNSGALPAYLRRAPGLEFSMRLPLTGKSVDLNDDVIAAVGIDGLATLPAPGRGMVLEPLSAGGTLDPRFGPGFYDTYHGAIWRQGLVLLCDNSYYASGHLSGFQSLSVNYSLATTADPRAPVVVGTGSLGDSEGTGGNDYDPCGLATLRFLQVGAERALIAWGDGCSQSLRLWDAREGRVVGTVTESCVEPGSIGLTMLGDVACVFGHSGWPTWYDLASDTPLASLAVPALVRTGPITGPDRGLAVVYVWSAREYDVYDLSGLPDLVHCATIASPAAEYAASSVWLGRRLVSAGTAGLCVLDFTVPAAPVATATLPLPGQPNRVQVFAIGNRVLLQRALPVQGVGLGYEVSVVDLDGQGLPTVHAPITVGAAVSGAACSGDVLYCADATNVRAYDIGNPDLPRLLGLAARGEGNLAVVGDYVVSGGLLMPRDRRDLRPPRALAIDLLPAVRPTGEGATLVPVAVHEAPGFDPARLDAASLRFGPGAAPVVTPPAAKTRRLADGGEPLAVGATYWFDLAATGLTTATAEARLTGRTIDGEEVLGIACLGPGTSPVAAAAGTDLAAGPNPFNPQTTLSFTLAQAGPCRLAIHDLNGRRICTLVDGERPGGRQAVTWDGCDSRQATVASGVYIARLEAGGLVATLRLVLLK